MHSIILRIHRHQIPINDKAVFAEFKNKSSKTKETTSQKFKNSEKGINDDFRKEKYLLNITSKTELFTLAILKDFFISKHIIEVLDLISNDRFNIV